MLCEPILHAGKSPVLASVQTEQGHITMRHLDTDSDIPFVFDLLKRETQQNWDPNQLLEGFKASFSYMARSENSQVFIIDFDGQPFLAIEIHNAVMHAYMHSGFEPKEGDYYVNIFGGDFEIVDFQAYLKAINICLNYFFGFPELNNLLFPLIAESDKDRLKSLLEKAGAAILIKKSRLTDWDLYMISRPPTISH